MDKLQQLRTLVKKRHDENWEKRNNVSCGTLCWERALVYADILAVIDSIPRFKVGDVIKSGSYTYTIKDMDEDAYILDGDKVLTFNVQYDWELVEESQRMISAKAKEAGYSKLESKDFTFKSISRILEMVKPSERTKSYCEKLAKSLENEGYPADAKIVRESIKMMNGEKVPMATMDEEPVSEDLEKAAEAEADKMLEVVAPELASTKYLRHTKMRVKTFDGTDIEDAFMAGANWQKEQFEKNRLAACDSQTEEEAEREWGFVEQMIKKEHRQPTYSDAIEYGMKLQKEQMMKGAVDAEVTYGKSLAIPSLGYFLDKNEMDVGDEVKLILIKSEMTDNESI